LVVSWQPFTFVPVNNYMKQYSVTEYATLKGISRQAVLKQIDAKKLDAKKIGNSYVITIK
jgi:predicted DNA-binding protein YlxM (UPF0122 family)